jgi:hypothetical protein
MRGDIFPLGVIQLNECNIWRETLLALHLIKQAATPQLNIKQCIQDWKQIAKLLSESPRKRRPQAEKYLN